MPEIKVERKSQIMEGINRVVESVLERGERKKQPLIQFQFTFLKSECRANGIQLHLSNH